MTSSRTVFRMWRQRFYFVRDVLVSLVNVVCREADSVKGRWPRSVIGVHRKVGQIGANGKFVASKGEKGKGKMKVRRDKDGNLVVTEETAAERARRKVRVTSNYLVSPPEGKPLLVPRHPFCGHYVTHIPQNTLYAPRVKAALFLDTHLCGHH